MALENYGKMYLRAGFTSLISSSQKRLLFTEKLNKSQEMENFTVHTNSTVCKKSDNNNWCRNWPSQAALDVHIAC